MCTTFCQCLLITCTHVRIPICTQVKEGLVKHARAIYSMFDFYSSLGSSGDIKSM